MNPLPRYPVYPKRMGAIQAALYESVLNAANAFADSVEPLDPRQAQVTLMGFLRANLGYDAREVERSANAMIDRRILKKGKVGYALADEEYERLLQQAVYERTKARYD